MLTHAPVTADSILQKFDNSMQVVIQRLKIVLGFTAGISHEIVMFPSGSDAEFLPLAVALVRSHTLSLSKRVKQTTGPAAKVFNFVLAAGEVGSGTPNGTMRLAYYYSVLSITRTINQRHGVAIFLLSLLVAMTSSQGMYWMVYLRTAWSLSS